MALDLQFFVELLDEYGYLIVFLAALGEALPLLGLLIPGQAVILLAGAAAASGVMNIWWLIAAVIPAGIAGDAVSYYLGRHYGRDLLVRYGEKFRITDRHLARSDALFARYGPLALVFARFSFLTRSVGPLLAGMSHLPQRIFWIFNVLGAFAWAFAYGLGGYFFGLSFLVLQGVVGRILAGTLLGIVALYGLYRLLRHYAAQFTRDDFYVALMGVVAGAIFGVLADRVARLGSRNALDVWIVAMQDALSPFSPLLRVGRFVTQTEVLVAVALVLLVVLAVRRHIWGAVLVGLGVGGALLVVESVRPLLARALAPEYAAAGGFPSLGAAVSLVFAGVLTYIVAAWARRPWAPLVAIVGGVVLSLLGGFARLEYPSAIFAGYALGAAWLSVAILIVEFGLKRQPAAPPA